MKNQFQINCFSSLGHVGNSPIVCPEAWNVSLFCVSVHPLCSSKIQPGLFSALALGPRILSVLLPVGLWAWGGLTREEGFTHRHPAYPP